MAQEEQKNEIEDQAPVEAEQQPAKKGKPIKQLAILGVIVAVIGIECGAAYKFISSAAAPEGDAAVAEKPEKKAEGKSEEKAAKHGEKSEAKHGEKGEAKGEGKGEAKHGGEGEGSAVDRDPEEQIEVMLGEFSVTTFQPATNTTLRIEFNLYGTVLAKDEQEFLGSLEDNKHRFRDQVLVIVRSAEITDLTDAGLGLVKRKIMEKTNRMIGKPLLHSVIFSDFSFVEQ
jgi:flagellar basal body-associated protein FliL